MSNYGNENKERNFNALKRKIKLQKLNTNSEQRSLTPIPVRTKYSRNPTRNNNIEPPQKDLSFIGSSNVPNLQPPINRFRLKGLNNTSNTRTPDRLPPPRSNTPLYNTYQTEIPLRRKPSGTSSIASNSTQSQNENGEYQGICPNCMNGAIKDAHCHKPSGNLDPNDEPFARQALRNANLQKAITQKIMDRYNLSQKAGSHIGEENQKDKLINSQQNNEFKLNLPTKDVLRQRQMDKYNQNEKLLNKGVVKFGNPNVESFYACESANCVTDSSVCAIGAKKYKNKYLPTLDNYKKFLDDQINAREVNKIREREKDKKLEREMYEKNQRELERERELRRNYIQQMKNDFLKNNKLLIESKSKNDLLNKSTDLANEQRKLRQINEEMKKTQEEANERKLRIRKELMNQLESQILNKKNKKDDCCCCKGCNINDKNIYREAKKYDEYGRCINCKRQFKKQLLSSIREYKKIKKGAK